MRLFGCFRQLNIKLVGGNWYVILAVTIFQCSGKSETADSGCKHKISVRKSIEVGVSGTVGECYKFFNEITVFPFAGCPYRSIILGAPVCCIQAIDAKALIRYGEIKELNIEFNYITHLEGQVFQNNSKLLKIQLNNNDITSVHEDAFQGLQKLLHLNLDNNFLRSLPMRVFEPCHQLRYLSMQGNQLQTVEVQYVLSLRVLNLAGNHLLEWTQQLDVEQLNLGDNQLKRWMKLRMPNLERLDLSNNSIVEMDPRSFSLSGKISHLDLSGNQLAHLDRDIVHNLCGLEYFAVRNNQLTTPYVEWFEALVDKYDLPLLPLTVGNQWRCTDALKPFQDFLSMLRNDTVYRMKGWAEKFRIDCTFEHGGKSLEEIQLSCLKGYQGCGKPVKLSSCRRSSKSLIQPSDPKPIISSAGYTTIGFVCVSLVLIMAIMCLRLKRKPSKMSVEAGTQDVLPTAPNTPLVEREKVIRTSGYCEFVKN